MLSFLLCCSLLVSLLLNLRILLCRKEKLARSSIINYRNTDKPVFFILSFVAFDTQAKNSIKVSPAIMENTENILMKRTPHISIRKSHSVSISAMANSFHDIISKAQHEKCLIDLYVSY